MASTESEPDKDKWQDFGDHMKASNFYEPFDPLGILEPKEKIAHQLSHFTGHFLDTLKGTKAP